MAILYEAREGPDGRVHLFKRTTEEWLRHTVNQALHISGLADNAALKESIFKNAFDRVSPHNRRFAGGNVSDSHPEVAEELRYCVEFAAAVHAQIVRGTDLKTALINEGTKDRDAYYVSGFTQNETIRHVTNAIGFASTVYLDQRPSSVRIVELFTVAIPARSSARIAIFGK